MGRHADYIKAALCMSDPCLLHALQTLHPLVTAGTMSLPARYVADKVIQYEIAREAYARRDEGKKHKSDEWRAARRHIDVSITEGWLRYFQADSIGELAQRLDEGRLFT